MSAADLYEAATMQELVAACMERGMLVTPEMLTREHLTRALGAGTVHVLKSYAKPARSRTVQDFVRYFGHRYKAIAAILKGRKELENVTSIARVRAKREREQIAIIGMVYEKRETKNGSLVLTLEDQTGTVDVWIPASNRELMIASREIVLDEVIGIVGQSGNGKVFASGIHFPDVPIQRELKRGPRDVEVAFVGDVEIGSNLFMRDAFDDFLAWLNGDLGTPEQRAIAAKVGYVIFIGDLVHGVGVYPGQQRDSNIHDIREQYRVFAEYVARIPSHMQVLMIPGNHDAGRLQEPQLAIPKDLAPELYAMPNVTILSNPSTVTIERNGAFNGFELLLYHGYSLVYYSQEVQPIKDAGGMDAMDAVMRLYLRKRHLAPTHGSNTYIPDPDEDPLVISSVPDFVITGHVHNVAVGTYNGVQMINAGCWNDISDEQIKRGLQPEPAKLPVVNLKTREIRIMNFYPEKTETQPLRGEPAEAAK